MTRLLATLALACALAVPAGAAMLGDDIAGGSAADQLLPADDAFILGAERQADSTVVLHWTIADGYYLYRDRMQFTLDDAGEAALGAPRFGPAETKDDPYFGRVQVYHQEASVRLPLSGTPAPGAQLDITYQGCNEPIGVCYPPITKRLALASIEQVAATGSAADGSEQDRIAAALGHWSAWWTALAFVGFGVLLSLTPCVFPMIPILAGIVVGDARAGRTRRGAALSVVFVLSMALSYALVGIAVGLTGASIQAWFQQPWVLGAIAAVFVLLAASMFGLFDLETPRALRSVLEHRTHRLGGSVAGAAALGVTSAVVVGPCVTPPLIGALVYIAHTGDPVTGGLALFALGLGMGVPLVVAGTFAGHALPRAGAWMQQVQAVFGVLLLAVAIWLLQRVLPTPVSMALWSVLLIVTGVQMGAFASVDGGWRRTWKGIGTVLLLYGALLLVGAAAGGQSLLQPLRGIFVGGDGTTTAVREFRDVDGEQGLRDALSQARRAGRPVVLDVYADWCVSCQELETITFRDPGVQQALRGAELLRVDITDSDRADRQLMDRFDLYGPPAVLFFDATGIERRGHRIVGYLPPDRFARHARRALAPS